MAFSIAMTSSWRLGQRGDKVRKTLFRQKMPRLKYLQVRLVIFTEWSILSSVGMTMPGSLLHRNKAQEEGHAEKFRIGTGKPAGSLFFSLRKLDWWERPANG